MLGRITSGVYIKLHFRSSGYCPVGTKLSQHLSVLTDNFIYPVCVYLLPMEPLRDTHFLLGEKGVMVFSVSGLSSKKCQQL